MDVKALQEQYPRLDGERESEYAMRLADLHRNPWRVVKTETKDGVTCWVIINRLTWEKDGKMLGPYVKEKNARNRAAVLNERARAEDRNSADGGAS